MSWGSGVIDIKRRHVEADVFVVCNEYKQALAFVFAVGIKTIKPVCTPFMNVFRGRGRKGAGVKRGLGPIRHQALILFFFIF